MKEILAGDDFYNAVGYLGLSAKNEYGSNGFEVWSIDDTDFQKITEIPDEQWKEEWGWWRYAEGSNISDWPVHSFIVNNKEILGYYNPIRFEEYIDNELVEDDYFATRYLSLTAYMCIVIGVSSLKNICAIAVDLAKLNGISMSELFTRYEP